MVLLAACGGGSSGSTAAGTSEASSGASTQAPASDNTTQTAALPATKELKIYNWSDYVDPETIKDFEKTMASKWATICMTATSL